jgi:hypothetical protein
MSVSEVTGGKVWEPIDDSDLAFHTAQMAQQSFKFKIGISLLIIAFAIAFGLNYLGFKSYNNYSPTQSFDLTQGTQDKIRYILYYFSIIITVLGAFLINKTIYSRLEMTAILVAALTLLFSSPILTASLNAYESVEVWVEDEYGLRFTNEINAESFNGVPIYMKNENGENMKVTFKTKQSIITLVEQEKVDN